MIEIQVYNLKKRALEIEKVFQSAQMHTLYGTQYGKFLMEYFLSRRWFSRLYGAYYDTARSQSMIADFIRDFDIKMEEFEEVSYKTFNEFFVRKFRPGAREFGETAGSMPAFCEGRYLGLQAAAESLKISVKARQVSVSEIIAHPKWQSTFTGGPLLVARLAPIDYHRFHFMDEGVVHDHYRIQGRFHSVNPIAYQQKNDILWTNERQVSILETKNFGWMAYVEVGALAVGRIVQTHTGAAFKRGEEKGYFQFGGSTIVVIGEPGRWSPEEIILDNTKRGVETLVELGQKIAQAQ
jgi:phosphatidylserine decarboxylase